MDKFIPDPDFEGWNGKFVDNSVIAPPAEYNHTLLIRYLKSENKNFKDLSQQELEQFKI